MFVYRQPPGPAAYPPAGYPPPDISLPPSAPPSAPMSGDMPPPPSYDQAVENPEVSQLHRLSPPVNQLSTVHHNNTYIAIHGAVYAKYYAPPL